MALVLTMFASLVLGMGLPTAAAYILVATLVAPALVELGVPLLAAHFFVFYSAMLSSITPPVAMAAYAAAGIAKASPLKIAVTASIYGISAFIIPYAIVLRPSLLGVGTWVEVTWAALNAMIVGIGLAAMVSGYWLRPLNFVERAAMGVASFAILFWGWQGVALGAAIIACISILQWRHLSQTSSEQRIT